MIVPIAESPKHRDARTVGDLGNVRSGAQGRQVARGDDDENGAEPAVTRGESTHRRAERSAGHAVPR